MKTKAKKSARLIFVNAGFLLLILIGFSILKLHISYHSTNQSNYNITCNPARSDTSDFSVDLFISKEWLDHDFHKSLPCGAQYDGTITNNTDELLKDWTLEIELPGDIFLDSSWNGNYILKDGSIILTPVDYNAEILPGETVTFGYVLYSEKLLNFEHCSLSGYREVKYFSSPLFWGLMILSTVWGIALLLQAVTWLHTRKYIKRQKKDAEIILQSMNTFAGMIDAKDSYTRGHSTRVAIYSREIARRMDLKSDEIDTLYYIALMHDCGKVGIPDAILTKPGALTPDERELIQSHTTMGGNILDKFTAIDGIRNGALYHHERYDGHGYPKGLKGNEIPLCARIICIADSYDAMSSKRCYRKPLSQEKILEELTENAGTQFDPSIVTFMIEMIQDGFVKQVHTETE